MLWKLQSQDCVPKYAYQSGCCTTAAQSLNIAQVACVNWGSCADTALYKQHTRLVPTFIFQSSCSGKLTVVTPDTGHTYTFILLQLTSLKQPLQLRSNGHCRLWAPHIALTHNKGLPSFNTSAHAKGARMDFNA